MAFLAIGSNQISEAGEPPSTVLASFRALRDEGLEIIAESRLYSTPCVPAGAGPDYVNAAVALRTQLPAPELLALLHRVEARFDRQRTSRWAARTLDLDLIDLGGAVLPDLATWRHWADLNFDAQSRLAPEELILPHPRVQDRAFVLVPLAEIAPDWVHPVFKLSAAELRDRLPEADLSAIRPLAGANPLHFSTRDDK